MTWNSSWNQSNKAGKRKKKKQNKQMGKGNLYGIKQGVGSVTNNPFPKQNGNKKKKGKRKTGLRNAFNAMHSDHLALPRAVGGYTVTRTTDVFTINNRFALFGCFKAPRENFGDGAWSTIIGVRPALGGYTKPIGDDLNATFLLSTALRQESLLDATMVPAAITVQVMNPGALQSTSGITYIGRSKTVLGLQGDTRTWEELSGLLVNYSAPRLCSAGKLALRGVQVDAIPNNMSVLSDFVPRTVPKTSDTEYTASWTSSSSAATPTVQADLAGFAPIFISNPDSTELQVIVTVEWRMRFDPLNPAYSGHTVHPPASESTWSEMIRIADSLGNGVRDIADITADIGMAARVAGVIAA